MSASSYKKCVQKNSEILENQINKDFICRSHRKIYDEIIIYSYVNNNFKFLIVSDASHAAHDAKDVVVNSAHTDLLWKKRRNRYNNINNK